MGKPPTLATWVPYGAGSPFTVTVTFNVIGASAGNSSGMVNPVSPTTLNRKSLYLTRPNAGDYTSTRQELLERAEAVLGWVNEGKLKLHISRRFPLKDAAAAHRMFEGRLSVGKLLLVP